MSDLLQKGGWVIVAILGLSLACWTLILVKALELRERSRGGTEWVGSILERGAWQTEVPAAARSSLIGELVRAAQSYRRANPASFGRVLRAQLAFDSSELRRHLGLISTMAGVLPLLGLLGTVLGMVVTFEALTMRGDAESIRLADGISQALLTTQAGLICALPALVAVRLLGSRIRRFLQRAELCLHQMELSVRQAGGGRP